MKKQKNLAFTLVELIVVITILAILGTIAFIAMQGYSSSARNSKRISDINNIKTSLALFNTRTGRYPEPDNITDVKYIGATVWSQGEVGEQVTRNLKELGKTPLDPLLETPYVYSLLNTKKEYEVGSIFEGNLLTYDNKLLSKTDAASKTYYAYIKGDYNGKVAKVTVANTLYVFAIPSIIGADLTDPDIETLIENKLLVFNGYQNIPSNYGGGNNITMTGSFNYGGTGFNSIIYSGSIEDLSTSYESLQIFGTNLKTAYSGSILSNNGDYNNISLMDIEDSDNLRQIAGTIVKENLGGEIAPAVKCATKPSYTHTNFISGNVLLDGTSWQNISSGTPCYYYCTDGYHGTQCEIAPICATKPSYSNTSFLDGTVVVDGTTRQNTTLGNPCYYSCTGGYSGNDCSIPPPLIIQTECESAGWYWVNNTQDMYIGTGKGNGFCISPKIGDFTGDVGISWNGWGNDTQIYYQGWNATAIDDTGNARPQWGQTKRLDSYNGYTCKTIGNASNDFDTNDNIVGRMKWLANNGTNLTEFQNIDWVQNAIPPNGHSIPALFIADCIDGVKDLGTTMIYKHINNSTDEITYTEYNTNVSIDMSYPALSDITYQNRQKYLTAWTQKKGSHLPSAFSYINDGYASANVTTTSVSGNGRGEYQVACEQNIILDCSSRIWTSAIGKWDGIGWGTSGRLMNGPSDQESYWSGRRSGDAQTRFIIRP